MSIFDFILLNEEKKVLSIIAWLCWSKYLLQSLCRDRACNSFTILANVIAKMKAVFIYNHLRSDVSKGL